MTGLAENKYFTEPPYYTHVQQNKQVLILAADAGLTQTLTPILPLIFRKSFRHSDTYAVVTFLTLALKQGSHI